jgi:hypothetical protein
LGGLLQRHQRCELGVGLELLLDLGKGRQLNQAIISININNLMKVSFHALKASKHIASNYIGFGGSFERRWPR